MLNDDEIPEYVNVRDLVSNLCDFQDRFANPMAFPVFEPNPNKPSRLETPRHLPSLIRFKCAYQLPDKYIKEDIDPLDGIIQDGKVYCFAGSELWSSALESGDLELPEEELEEPVISRYEWIQDLFHIFNYVKDSKKRSIARELASCWYFISTHISLEMDDEEEEQIGLMTQLLSSMNIDQNELFEKLNNIESFKQSPEELGTPASMLGALMNEGKENEEIETFGNNKSLAQLLLEGLNDSDEEDDDFIPEEENEEDDDYYISDEEDGDEVDEQVKDFVDKLQNRHRIEENEQEENQIETEFRNLVLQTVESLSCYLPTKKEWLERILSTAQSLEQEKKQWFPWGLPPMEKIKTSLNSKIHDVTSSLL